MQLNMEIEVYDEPKHWHKAFCLFENLNSCNYDTQGIAYMKKQLLEKKE